MSQQNIINILKKSTKPLSSKEISLRIGINHVNTCNTLKKLIKQNIVSYKKIKLYSNCRPYNAYVINVKSNYL